MANLPPPGISVAYIANVAPAASADFTAASMSSTNTYGRTTGSSSSRIGPRTPIRPPPLSDAVRALPNAGTGSPKLTPWTFSKVDLADCARFVSERGVDVDGIFTQRYDSLERGTEAYELFDTQTTGKGVFLL